MSVRKGDPAPGPFGPEDGFVPQKMVRWLGPRGLATTAMQVGLSTIFGAYSDKREIQAALKEPWESDFSDRDELWFDWLADTGDGFNPTLTTARLLREDLDLTHNGSAHSTKRGELLVLGGDMAYPAATPASYRDRFVGPFAAAYPEPADGEAAPTMIVCAGNHDWYDGLTTFLRLFCQHKPIGGWQTEQTRSYFTVQLPHRWWIMGIDLAFDFFIDEPQMEFFRHEASERLQPGDKVILVTHRPSWLFPGIGEQALYSPMSMTNLQQFEHDIIHANGLELPLVLAGDIHHYNRYAAPNGRQRITCGAGAAFLYPTNHLHKTFPWPDAEGRTTYKQQIVYPNARISRKLRWGTILAPFKNPSFIAFVGALYLLFALSVRFAIPTEAGESLTEALRDTTPAEVAQSVFNNPPSFLLAVFLAATMVIFADGRTRPGRLLFGLIHFALHFALLVSVVWWTAELTLDVPWTKAVRVDVLFLVVDLSLETTAFILGVALVGGYLGSQLFSLYLFLMFTLFRKHATHAFSSQHIADYRSFLRLKIDAGGALTVYPIGVHKVPRKWRRVEGDRPAGAPMFEPVDRTVECHLIEEPIRIEATGSSSTAGATPDQR